MLYYFPVLGPSSNQNQLLIIRRVVLKAHTRRHTELPLTGRTHAGAIPVAPLEDLQIAEIRSLRWPPSLMLLEAVEAEVTEGVQGRLEGLRRLV